MANRREVADEECTLWLVPSLLMIVLIIVGEAIGPPYLASIAIVVGALVCAFALVRAVAASREGKRFRAGRTSPN